MQKRCKLYIHLTLMKFSEQMGFKPELGVPYFMNTWRYIRIDSSGSPLDFFGLLFNFNGLLNLHDFC